MLGDLATDLEMRSRLALLQLLKERGVKILTNWKVEKIENGYVLLVSRDWEKLEVATNSVILALGLTSNQELLKPLRESFREVYAVGDCVEPRKIYQAIHEGAFAGRMI
jgi:2-enoate reductase